MAKQPKRQKSTFAFLSTISIALIAMLLLWYIVSLFEKAPKTEFHLLDGRKISTRSLEGKPVLVMFWSLTCKVCLEETPALIRMYKKLQPRGFELVAVSMAHDRPDQVQRFSKRQRIPYLMAVDVDSKVKTAFGRVPGTPTLFLISRRGFIKEHHTGATDIPALEQKIIKLLPKKKAG